MTPSVTQSAIIFIVLQCLFIPATADANKSNSRYLEVVTETDGSAELKGLHLLLSFTPKAAYSLYFGGGLVYVDLPEQNESFPGLHAFAGVNLNLSRFLGFNLEAGLDIGESLLGDDESNIPSVDPRRSNQIDSNVSAGVVVYFKQLFYLKTYVRYHVFDGYYLPRTSVTMTGIRLGINF